MQNKPRLFVVWKVEKIMKKRLYKSTKLKMICGVCGGWAELLNWDPTIIRILFCALTLFKGVGLFLYLVLAIITPFSNDLDSFSEDK